MSNKIMTWVWDNSPYEGKALLIHIALADFSSDEGYCWPSQSTLARKARCTERYVRDTIKTMIEDGYVVITQESNGRMSHKYRLLARNSVPRDTSGERNSETFNPELRSTYPGTEPPKNHQEPSIEPSNTVLPKIIRCNYCTERMDGKPGHYCSAMNMYMRHPRY